ncbi:MAG: cytochrome c-type biogenesis protein [Porticoccaceae bacterium]
MSRKQRIVIPLLAALLATLSATAWAVVDVEQPTAAQQRERYHHLIDEMRCPKCQNQNLADSDAPIAADLRREIRRLLDAGNSDQQIIDHMVVRYGEFILYRPRWQPATWLLWLAPSILLGLGVLIAVWVIARQRRQTSPGTELTASEAVALREMLDEFSAEANKSAPPERRS